MAGYSPDISWTNLPTDICLQIFSRLRPFDLLRIRSVCTHWRLLEHTIMETVSIAGPFVLRISANGQKEYFSAVASALHPNARPQNGDRILVRRGHSETIREVIHLNLHVDIRGEPPLTADSTQPCQQPSVTIACSLQASRKRTCDCIIAEQQSRDAWMPCLRI